MHSERVWLEKKLTPLDLIFVEFQAEFAGEGKKKRYTAFNYYFKKGRHYFKVTDTKGQFTVQSVYYEGNNPDFEMGEYLPKETNEMSYTANTIYTVLMNAKRNPPGTHTERRIKMHDNIIEQYAEEKGLSRSDTGVLIKMEKAAQQLGPDRHLYNLTKSEIVDYLSSLQLSSYTSVRKYVSMIKVFITYCMNIGVIPQGENVGDTFSQQEMESCLSVYKFHTKQLSKELIEEFVHFLENPSDQFMVLGSF